MSVEEGTDLPVVTGHPLDTSTFLTASWAKSDLLYPIGGEKAPLQIWVECHMSW